MKNVLLKTTPYLKDVLKDVLLRILTSRLSETVWRAILLCENHPPRDQVTFMQGLWQDVIADLPDNSVDGILYDTSARGHGSRQILVTPSLF